MHKSTLLLFADLLLRTTLPAQCWQKINAGAMQVGDLQTIRIASKMLAIVRFLVKDFERAGAFKWRLIDLKYSSPAGIDPLLSGKSLGRNRNENFGCSVGLAHERHNPEDQHSCNGIH